jgi:hypothetical protein
MAAVGPHSRPHRFTKPDKRTREGRALETLRAALLAHVGGQPSAPQTELIERALGLKWRTMLLDKKLADHGELSTLDAKTYLGQSNALERVLCRLGLAPSAPPGKTLEDHLAARYAGQASHEAA